MDTRGWPTGEALIKVIREETDTIFLAFSAGKDSILAWLTLRPHFKRIIPIFQYLIPDLEFIEEGLRYYEDYFQTKIVRVPHVSLYRMLNNFVLQPPERWPIIQEFELPRLTQELLRDSVADDLGLPDGTWIAVGIRAVDNPQRLMSLRKHGPFNHKRRCFYPVWDVRKAELVDTLRKHQIQLPKEYRIFGRSFDGIDFRFLWGIREHFPRDYERILQWFPLADIGLARYEFIQRRKTGSRQTALAGGSDDR